MKTSQFKNALAFSAVIAGLCAAIFIPSNLSYILSIAWAVIVFASMMICLKVCNIKIVEEMKPDLVLRILKFKHKIFYAYWTRKHLPVLVDMFFYFTIVILASLYEMYLLSGIWVAIAWIDLRLRNMADIEEARIIIHAVARHIEKLREVAK